MKKIMNYVACFLSGAVVASTIGVLAATYTATPNEFPIKVNGQNVQMEGYNIEGSTYFKLRDIGDKMGFAVDFQDSTILIGDNVTSSKTANAKSEFYTVTLEMLKGFDDFFQKNLSNANAFSDKQYDNLIQGASELNNNIANIRAAADDAELVQLCDTAKTATDKAINIFQLMKEDAKLVGDMSNPTYIDDIFQQGEKLLNEYSDFLKAYQDFTKSNN